MPPGRGDKLLIAMFLRHRIDQHWLPHSSYSKRVSYPCFRGAAFMSTCRSRALKQLSRPITPARLTHFSTWFGTRLSRHEPTVNFEPYSKSETNPHSVP